MKFNRKLSIISALSSCAILVAACGGGGGGGGGGETNTISGRVLDGAVGSSRVCIDYNSDNQCTSTDSYVETDENGYYELTYSSSAEIEQYAVIADVRFSEASDGDYASGTPDYDYVMNAFDVSPDKENIISPITTYMTYEQINKGLPSETITENTVQIIEQYEQYEYSEEIEIEYEYTEYITGDFVANQDSSDPHVVDYNTRIHNINELMAREMQESQAVYEDRFYSGDLTLDNYDWSENSDLVVTNANSNVFQSFEFLVEETTSYDYQSFNALEVSDSLFVDVPSAFDLQDLLEYADLLFQASEEFSGNTYVYSQSINGQVLSTNYIVFSPQGVTLYIEFTGQGGGCSSGSIPFDVDVNASESDFVSQFNQVISNINAQNTGIIYSSLTQVSSPPSGCSSFANLLANFSTAASLDSGSEGEIFMAVPDEDACQGPLCGWEPPPAQMATAPPARAVPSLSGGNTAPASISTCNYGDKQYAINPCRTPSRKD